MERLGIGIVGFGFIGRIHALAFSSLPFYYADLPFIPEIRGICTSREDTARKAQEETGVPFVTSRFEELVHREDIDVIVVATPNALHLPVVFEAARAKKAIYCDKPLASSLEEAEKIREAVTAWGVPFGMAFQNRFVPAILRARELIQSGFLGEVTRVRVQYLHSGYNDPLRPMSWRLDRKLSGGGALADLGSHGIDLVRYLLGDFTVESARARTFVKRRPKDASREEFVEVLVDDWAEVLGSLPGGAPVTLEASRFATGSCDELRLEIEGMEGAIRYNSMQPNFLLVYDARRPSGPYGGERGFQHIESVHQYPYPNRIPGKFAIGWVRAHIACAHDFLLHLAGKPSLGATLEDGVAVQRVLERAYELSGY
ncbi:MAG: Gfo/Idh/MocA family oxidoreductase [Candidatus Caldatribacterium sp.]|nr:Gfo/Idh/MocA family oxidoreductase [Candidatus Caldatribacterium sp.]